MIICSAIPWDIWPKKNGCQLFGANYEYFRLSTARDDKNDRKCPSSFFSFWSKMLLNFILMLKKMRQKMMKLSGIVGYAWVFFVILSWYLVLSRQILTTIQAKLLKSAWIILIILSSMTIESPNYRATNMYWYGKPRLFRGQNVI